MNSPEVTIVIPTCDRPALLDRALKLALNQEYPSLKIIVVDNSGDDASANVVSRYSGLRLTYVRHPSNIGLIQNFIYGVSLVGSPFVALLPDDDLIHPAFIATCVSAINSWPGLTSCFVSFDSYCHAEESSSTAFPYNFSPSFPADWRRPEMSDLHNQKRNLCLCAGIHQASYLRNAFLSYSWAGIATDTAILCDLIASRKSVICNSVLYLHSRHPGQATNAIPLKSLTLEISVYRFFIAKRLEKKLKAAIVKNLLLDLAIVLDNTSQSSEVDKLLALRRQIFRLRPFRLRNNIALILLFVKAIRHRLDPFAS